MFKEKIKKEFREFLNESLRRLPDNDIDLYIKKNWKGVLTFEFNISAATQLSKLVDVIYTQDSKYMYINSDMPDNTKIKIDEIIKKFKIKSLD